MEKTNTLTLPSRVTGRTSWFDKEQNRPVYNPAEVVRLFRKTRGAPSIRRFHNCNSYSWLTGFDCATLVIWKPAHRIN